VVVVVVVVVVRVVVVVVDAGVVTAPPPFSPTVVTAIVAFPASPLLKPESTVGAGVVVVVRTAVGAAVGELDFSPGWLMTCGVLEVAAGGVARLTLTGPGAVVVVGVPRLTGFTQSSTAPFLPFCAFFTPFPAGELPQSGSRNPAAPAAAPWFPCFAFLACLPACLAAFAATHPPPKADTRHMWKGRQTRQARLGCAPQIPPSLGQRCTHSAHTMAARPRSRCWCWAAVRLAPRHTCVGPVP